MPFGTVEPTVTDVGYSTIVLGVVEPVGEAGVL